MNTQNYALSFLGKAVQPGIGLKKADASSKDDFLSFKNILDDKVGKSPSNSVSAKNSDNSGKDVQQKQEPHFKSYKEIAKPRSSKLQEQSNKASGVSEDSQDQGQDKEIDKADEKIQADYTLQSLAAVLGVNPQDFAKMLEKMNIKPEDLTDAAKLDSVIDKLSVSLNLNDGQKSTLDTIIRQVVDSVKQTSGQKTEAKPVEAAGQDSAVGQVKAKTAVEGVQIQNTSIITDKTNTEGKSFEEIVNEMKQKLNVLREQLQQNPDTTLEQISNEVKSIVSQVNEQQNVKADEITSDASSKIVDPKADAVKKTDAKPDSQNKENTEDNTDKQSESESSAAPIEMKHAKNEIPEKSQNNNEVRFDNLIHNQAHKANNTSDIPKLQKEIPIQKNEIINQVVEKAKVVLTGDKSEMVMDLKPDSLGKISLKVVTERGMVVAQFVAENQQVKETLEANMQLLKDSLQKQGLAVQGFSVSVDQNPYRGFNMNNGSNRNSSSNRQESSNIGAMVSVADIPESTKTINPYSWNESKINLTA